MFLCVPTLETYSLLKKKKNGRKKNLASDLTTVFYPLNKTCFEKTGFLRYKSFKMHIIKTVEAFFKRKPQLTKINLILQARRELFVSAGLLWLFQYQTQRKGDAFRQRRLQCPSAVNLSGGNDSLRTKTCTGYSFLQIQFINVEKIKNKLKSSSSSVFQYRCPPTHSERCNKFTYFAV